MCKTTEKQQSEMESASNLQLRTLTPQGSEHGVCVSMCGLFLPNSHLVYVYGLSISAVYWGLIT